jgi:folate-binding protein YgfZ
MNAMATSEYEAVRHGVGLVDRRGWGVLEATGRDRATFLNALLSNDVKSLAPGQGCAATLLDVHGKVQVVLVVWVLDDRILLITPPGAAATTLEALDRYLFSVRLVRGGGETGEPEIWIAAPAAEGERVWKAFTAAGTTVVGAEALEILRIEAGTPRFPVDIGPAVLLPEVPFETLVSYTKGCYPGQEVVVRIRDRGHVNRHLRGLVLDGDTVPPAGSEVVVDDAAIGAVTSATRSPGLGRPIALAMVRRQHAEPGSIVGVRVGDRVVSATVRALPFTS